MALGARKGGAWAKFLTGWRGGVTINIVLALLTLLTAIVCIIVAVVTKKIDGGPQSIMEGSCSRVTAVDMGFHAAANLVSVFFIASANYVAQVLVSPTRTEVSMAHGKGSWLDIGMPSLRNLTGISKGKAVLSMLVVIIAISSQQM